MSEQATGAQSCACTAAKYEDRQRLDDALASFKALCGVYNTYLCEAYHTPLRNCLSGLLQDAHREQEELFGYMNEKGLYQVQMAEETRVNAVKQKYQCFS